MSQSGNQGPDWWFAWLGHEDTGIGMIRFLALPVSFIIVLGTIFWTIWPS
jgi:hypothetical protein